MDIESYLRGVLRGELPRYFHIESFKAQCVAARTYALYTKRFKPAGPTFDVYDDEGSQVYSGVSVEDATSSRAVDETRGEVCSYDNNGKQDIFCTYYSSCCGGLSQHVNNVKPRDPNVPPLPAASSVATVLSPRAIGGIPSRSAVQNSPAKSSLDTPRSSDSA